MASAKADTISIGTSTLPVASGFLPIASIAFEPIIPIPNAAPKPGILIASAFAIGTKLTALLTTSVVSIFFN